MAEATDPFYPYFLWFNTQRVSTTGDSCAHVETIPYWRALLPSETGLDYSLRKLPPDVVRKLRSENKMGRADLAQGKWLTAEERFLRCKHMLLTDEAELKQLLGKQAYDFLVAWAVLPLAHVYQSQFESIDMLKKAVEVREEVLQRVSPSRRSHLDLVRVCETYYHTARYEWGKASSSEADIAAAVRDYATLMMCTEDEADSQLCFLLGVDHKYSGCFLDHELAASLRWIQEANGLWRKNAGDENKFYYYNLDYEAKLLMVRGKFSEAVKVLKNISATLEDSTRVEYISHPDHSGSGLKVQEMLQECCSQMGSSDLASEGISQEARHGRLHQQEHDFLQDQDWERRNAEAEPFGILAYHPILGRTPPLLGSSLGLRKATDDILAHEVRKLPRQIRDILHWFFTHNDSFDKRHGFEQFREFLVNAKGFLDGKTHDWFLSYYDLSLAEFYLYRVGKPQQALEIWTELMNCVRSQIPHKYLAKGYYMISNAVSVAVKYESDGNVQWSGDCAMPLANGERDSSMYKSWSQIEKNESYFWLYFGNWRNGKLEDALKWLREVKWQKAMISGEEDHSAVCDSTFGYICCNYEYLLCEVDLLMRLGKFEEAIPRLKELLITKHVMQGPQRLARQAKEWLHFCSFIHAGTSPVGIEPEDEVDLPSPTGCVADNSLMVLGMTCAKLVQSQTGLEYHLQKLPVPYRLAFRYHGNLGTSYFKDGKWDMAIFELEWCRELLSLLHQWLSPGMPPIVERACSWLSVWVAVPLAEIYQIRKMELKAAFELRLEVNRKIFALKEVSGEVFLIISASVRWIGAVLYQYAESSNDSILKHTILEILWKLKGIYTVLYQFVESCDDSSLKHKVRDVLAKGSVWSNKFGIEFDQLMINFIHYFAHNEYVVALKIAQQANQLFEERYREHEDYSIALSDFVVWEAECFISLQKPWEARAVLDSYHCRTILPEKDLPELIQKTYGRIKDGERHVIAQKLVNEETRIFINSARDLDTLLPEPFKQIPPEILELKRKRSGFVENEEFAKAIEISNELLDKTCNSVYYYTALFYHCMLYAELFCDLVWYDYKSSSLKFDELNAISEGETLKSLLGYLVELTKHPSSTLEKVPYLSSLLVMFQVLLAIRYFEYFGSTWAHITDTLKDDKHRQFQILHDDLVSYLKKENSVERFSNEAIEKFEVQLESTAKSKQYSEGWIEVLQSHKPIYRYLQTYNLMRVLLLKILFDTILVKDESTSSSVKFPNALAQRHIWNAFLYSEAERTRVMLYQLGFHKPSFNSRWDFIDDDLQNMGIIKGECANILK